LPFFKADVVERSKRKKKRKKKGRLGSWASCDVARVKGEEEKKKESVNAGLGEKGGRRDVFVARFGHSTGIEEGREQAIWIQETKKKGEKGICTIFRALKGEKKGPSRKKKVREKKKKGYDIDTTFYPYFHAVRKGGGKL